MSEHADIKTLSKADILRADDIKMQFVDMRPFAWPGGVWIVSLTATQRDAWEESLIRIQGKREATSDIRNARAKLLQKCICDQNRVLLFSEEEINALGAKSGEALDHLYDIARQMSGIGEKQVQQAVKSSELDQSNASNSVSV